MLLDSMNDVYAASVMTSNVRTVSPSSTVAEAARIMDENKINSVVVTDSSENMVGILTSSDVVGVLADNESDSSTTVKAQMTENVIGVDPSSNLEDAIQVLVDHGVHHVPVVDENRNVWGMISTTDITAYAGEFVFK